MNTALLLEWAARSFVLGTAVGLTLWLLQIRDPHSRSVAWRAGLFASLTLPVLTALGRVLFPDSQSVAPSVSPFFLRPLVSVEVAPEQVPRSSFDVIWTLYLIVAAAFLVRIALGLYRSSRLRRSARPVHEGWVQDMDVRSSDEISIPVTIGSTILVPPNWVEWDHFTRRAVLIHERAHVLRRDFFVHLFAGVHSALLWFNPFAWWLKRELLHLAEIAADDQAVSQVEDEVAYSELLLAFAANRSRARFSGVAMASGRTVERRIGRLLLGVRKQHTVGPWKRLTLGSFTFSSIVFSASVWMVPHGALPSVASILPPRVEASFLQAATTPAPAASTAPAMAQPQLPVASTSAPQYLQRWIDQEVPDLATPAERAAYDRLRDDAEREQFINLFWLRRDPTPGTAENEFKDDYYRRIVVANEQFTTKSGVVGWRTDRGRILIRYGLADEVESHAAGGTYLRQTDPDNDEQPRLRIDVPDEAVRFRRDSPLRSQLSYYPFERWRYRFIEGIGRNVIFEFVDNTMDGTYRLRQEVR